jgi:hypothetical protein
MHVNDQRAQNEYRAKPFDSETLIISALIYEFSRRLLCPIRLFKRRHATIITTVQLSWLQFAAITREFLHTLNVEVLALLFVLAVGGIVRAEARREELYGWISQVIRELKGMRAVIVRIVSYSLARAT